VTAHRQLVVVPTYNEAENIGPTLDRLRAAVPSADVLVVDDGSPDGTGVLADERAAADEQVQVMHREAKQGLGGAYLAGFAWGMTRGYDVLVEMDADGSHQPEQLPRLLGALEDADLVLGSRWVAGGSVVNWPLHRKALSRGGNLYTRLALGLPIHDATGGFRAFRRSTLEGIDLLSVTSEGYCFQIDLARRALAAGYRVVEVPITFVEREHGQSKMSGAIVRESLVKVTRWGLRRRAGQAWATTEALRRGSR
jgi:dolichol-phosphate mannosyltransferase